MGLGAIRHRTGHRRTRYLQRTHTTTLLIKLRKTAAKTNVCVTVPQSVFRNLFSFYAPRDGCHQQRIARKINPNAAKSNARQHILADTLIAITRTQIRNFTPKVFREFLSYKMLRATAATYVAPHTKSTQMQPKVIRDGLPLRFL